MKTPHERAVDIAHRVMGSGFSRALFLRLLEDDGDTGKTARELVRVLAKGIEEDRRAVAVETAPS
jgi:hypothetical protein